MFLEEGIVVTGPVINLPTAGAAASRVVFTIPVLLGQLVGVKSVKIRKVILFNNAAGNTSVLIGNGAAGTGVPVLMPALTSMNGLEDIYDNLPEVESFANITAWPAAAPALLAGGSIDIQLQVIVRG